MTAYQRGSVGTVTLVSILALTMALVGAWWGLKVLPHQRAAEARQVQARINALVSSKSFLSSPATKGLCNAMGGRWRPGQNTPPAGSMPQWIRTPDFCALPASDAGKACMSSSECESFCVGRMISGQNFEAHCYAERSSGPVTVGHLTVVEDGRPFFKLTVKDDTRRTADAVESVGAHIEVQAVDGSKLKVGQLVRATPELRDKPWFPSIGIPGT